MKGRIIVLLAIVTLVLTGASGFVYVTQDHTDPTINIPNDPILYTEGESEIVLLKGVTASDDIDGDLSANVRIYDISVLDDGKQAIVTYAVYDSHNNLRKESRIVDYKALPKTIEEEKAPKEEPVKISGKKQEKSSPVKIENTRSGNSETATSNVVKLDKNDTSEHRKTEREVEESKSKSDSSAPKNDARSSGGTSNQPAAGESADTPSQPSGGLTAAQPTDTPSGEGDGENTAPVIGEGNGVNSEPSVSGDVGEAPAPTTDVGETPAPMEEGN